jgi:uncharacterized protein (TIGR04255 family)
MVLDPNREVYPNAPLQFVAFEVRFPASPMLATQERRQELFNAVRGEFPISQSAPAVDVQVVLQGSPGSPSPPQIVQENQLVLTDRARRRAVIIGTRALLVQTTAYTRYEEFVGWIDLAVRALEATGEAAAIERIGLRYTDEIRIEGVEQPDDWTPYVVPLMLGPINVLEGAGTTTTQGLVQFAPAERERLTLRYGATQGWMVSPEGVLRTKTRDAGAYFLLDFDSFWMPSEDEELPEFVADEVLRICDELHGPVRKVFEAVITDKLRDDVLRRGSGQGA